MLHSILSQKTLIFVTGSPRT